MENTCTGSSKKKGFCTKVIERCRSFGSISPACSSEMTKEQSQSNPSSPWHAFSNRSKSISYHDFTKKKKSRFFFKRLQRSLSVGSWTCDMSSRFKFNPTSPTGSIARRSNSINRANSFRVVRGCFTVCVGPNKDRFVVKMICLNDPLFQALLEQAEEELGYAPDGPLTLPCDVEMFEKVMLEIEQQHCLDDSPKCTTLSRSPYRYGHISPPKFIVAGAI